jgi:protein-S-isoprenylcysteine O-methyltransferase Ste14
MKKTIIKSILHNIGVVLVSFIFTGAVSLLDKHFGFPRFSGLIYFITGSVLLLIGFLIRIWATYHFYSHSMRVIVLEAQTDLITDGPYRYSRNPLYIGGNVFMFYGAALILGSPTALILITLHLPFMDLMIRREEKQLENKFGLQWHEYSKRVRRWI